MSVEDAGGNLITAATDPITLAIGTNPGGTLACTTNPLNASGGVATFAGCQITGKTGTTYTLTASEPGLTVATSNTFSITIGAATKLAFTTQPGGGANAATWTTQPVVTVQDVGGNTVTSATNSITLAVGTNPGGDPGLHHQPARPPPAARPPSPAARSPARRARYTLTAAATGLTGTTSTAFTITSGTATQLVFTTQPGGGADGADLDHPAGRQRRGRLGQRGDHRHQLDHPGHRDQPRRHPRLHHQPARTPPAASPPSPAARSPARSAATP